MEIESSTNCYGLFQAWLKTEGKEYLKEGKCIYTSALVIWLMIFQRLKEGASLSRALDELSSKEFAELTGDCKRIRERNVSNNTGSYSRARKDLSVNVAKEVTDDLFHWLYEHPEAGKEESIPIFSIDGMAIELLYSKEVAKLYQPFCKGHYPLMRAVVCQNLATGLAIRPEYGPFAGRHQQSEVQLAKRIFARIPRGSICIGDRNFGIFSMVYHALESGVEVIFRLKNDQAKKILGRAPKNGIDQEVEWEASRHDLSKNLELSNGDKIKGRIICLNVRADPIEKVTSLYLFTTLKEPVEKIVEMYGLRWNVEIDIRTLKQTVAMEMLKVKSVEMAEKELLFGICAYNLVVAVRQLAAKRLNVVPRKLSFKRILGLVDIYSSKISDALPEEREELLERFWKAVGAAKHPNRTRKRTEPRALVRRKRKKYPVFSGTREAARKKLVKKSKWH